MKILTLTILSLLSLHAYGASLCDISLGSQIFLIGKIEQTEGNDLILKSNCPNNVLKKFTNIILDFEGEFSNQYLTTVYGKDFFPYIVKMNPNNITINKLETILNNHFFDTKNKQFTNLKLLGSSSFVILEPNETFEFNCSNCKSNGNKNIEINILSPGLGNAKKLWLSALVVEEVSILEATNHLNVFSNAAGEFSQQIRYVENPEIYFTNESQLMFYRTNKPLRRGDFLKRSDLSPIPLVKAGKPATVSINNDRLSLSTIAIPTGMGTIGESVQLRNPVTNKMIVGKVVGFDKVVIEL